TRTRYRGHERCPRHRPHEYDSRAFAPAPLEACALRPKARKCMSLYRLTTNDRIHFRRRSDTELLFSKHRDAGVLHQKSYLPACDENNRPTRALSPYGKVRRKVFDSRIVVSLRWVDFSIKPKRKLIGHHHDHH